MLIYDKGHAVKNWHSRWVKTMRELAVPVTDRMVLTGAPVMPSPADLPSSLAVAGASEVNMGARADGVIAGVASLDRDVTWADP